MLNKAIRIAAEAHAGQLDKANEPYILHPLRVMLCPELSGETERICAVLHDLIEDTDWTPEQLRAEGFSEQVLAALDCVTKREGEAYEDFILRAAQNPIARRVKIADLLDNSNLARLKNPTEWDLRRQDKYLRALSRLRQWV